MGDFEDHSNYPLLWIDPDGRKPFRVDLSMLDRGAVRSQVAMHHQRQWAGDFEGRPAIAKQIAAFLQVLRPTEGVAKQYIHACRNLFRFLDSVGYPVDSGLEELRDEHGVLIQRWLDLRVTEGTSYGRVKTLVFSARELLGTNTLLWPSRSRDENFEEKPVDDKAVRRAFNALKGEARSVKQMFAQGRSLADAGFDPRRKAYPRWHHWKSVENQAWLLRHLTSERLLTREEIAANGARWLDNCDREELRQPGPTYFSPMMNADREGGLVNKLRWFHPYYYDTAIFLWLFLIGTGWNLSTALSLDVTETWHTPHPQKEDMQVIKAFKKRAGRVQFALSLTRPEWHPFQIVCFMIECTASLRRTLIAERDLLRQAIQNLSPSKIARLSYLDQAIRSPWLYHTSKYLGASDCFGNDDSSRLNDIFREAARRNGLLEVHPELGKFATSDARDSWIGHAHIQSGYNVLVTQLSSQHASAGTLRHYLKRRQYRTDVERQVHTFHDAAFKEIADQRVLDPTRVKILISKGMITAEQQKRLDDYRQRTRLGMGCLNPTEPPRYIEPNHKVGSLCVVQRCTGCPFGVVFPESIDHLVKAYVELAHIKSQMPLASWKGSSLEDEAISIEKTLLSFDPAAVRSLTQRWTNEIRTGKLVVHDTYPSN